jgi:hypothetical protein
MASHGPALPGNANQTPPPAYGSRAPPGKSLSVLGHLMPHTKKEDYSDEEEDGEEGAEYESNTLSAININIQCPLNIQGDNNIVAVDTAQVVNKIAQGIVTSLKAMSMGGQGVPMIDEDGRPRPITVTAIAEVRIHGSRNVVGGTIRPKLQQLGPKRAQDNKEGSNVKREREGSEEVEAKRTRLG